jgi:hypothetical protein
MSQISDPGNALQRITHLLIEAEDPDDRGPLYEAGEEVLSTAKQMATKVRQTNKACTGEATLKFKMKAYRTKNKEVAIEIEPIITSKKPSLARNRGVQLYAGHEGELSTTAVQEEMPLFTKDTAKSIDGGKSETANEGAEAPKKQGKRAL